MRLTVYTDYALRLLMYLAVKDDGLATIAEVANSYGISKTHLMKVAHQLGQAGYVGTIRGRGGGLRLAMPVERINLGQVVRHTEPDMAVVACLNPVDALCHQIVLRAAACAGQGRRRLPRSAGRLFAGRSGEAAHAVAGAADHRRATRLPAALAARLRLLTPVASMIDGEEPHALIFACRRGPGIWVEARTKGLNTADRTVDSSRSPHVLIREMSPETYAPSVRECENSQRPNGPSRRSMQQSCRTRVYLNGLAFMGRLSD